MAGEGVPSGTDTVGEERDAGNRACRLCNLHRIETISNFLKPKRERCQAGGELSACANSLRGTGAAAVEFVPRGDFPAASAGVQSAHSSGPSVAMESPFRGAAAAPAPLLVRTRSEIVAATRSCRSAVGELKKPRRCARMRSLRRSAAEVASARRISERRTGIHSLPWPPGI